jgi:hypothetical protein
MKGLPNSPSANADFPASDMVRSSFAFEFDWRLFLLNLIGDYYLHHRAGISGVRVRVRVRILGLRGSFKVRV